MNIRDPRPRAALQVVGMDSPYPLADALGICKGEVPDWARRMLSSEMQELILSRWHASTEEVVFAPTEMTRPGNSVRTWTVSLAGLSTGLQFEVLASLAVDLAAHTRMQVSPIRTVIKNLRAGSASSVLHLGEDDLPTLAVVYLRRWSRRLEVAKADPDSEWHKDDIRLMVVKPGAKGGVTMHVGGVTQPWLRDVLVRVIQSTLHSRSESHLNPLCVAVTRFSEALGARADNGNVPQALTGAVMTSVVAALRSRSDLNDGMVNKTLTYVSSLLTQAKALSLTDRISLPASFEVREEHIVPEPVSARRDKGFPEATFRLLMGADDLYGERAMRLAATVPGTPFAGEQFVVALQLAANFGRRPAELCALRADRLQFGEGGQAELLYDNFKSGREAVWLPVDARSAALVTAWTALLRERFPSTPLSELALLPAVQQNPDGAEAMTPLVLSSWFRTWTLLLEQSIVLAHLHAATDLTVERLCGLTLGEIESAALVVDGTRHALPTEAAQGLVDYKADVQQRATKSKYVPSDLRNMPLFPDPVVKVGGQQTGPRRGRANEFTPVPHSRFEGLGDGWADLGAGYASFGFPGNHLGTQRIQRGQLVVRLFRHTYLQHLINIGTDVFLVQELADHASVQTTMESYVRVNEQQLREAVDEVAKYRMRFFASPGGEGPTLPSRPSRDMRTNDCTNPQVLQLGGEGCDHDRMCYRCVYIYADPSNIPDIKAEIRTCQMSIARLEAEDMSDLKPHHLAVLRDRRDGWTGVLRNLQDHLDALDRAERERVDTAIAIIRGFRDRVRLGLPGASDPA